VITLKKDDNLPSAMNGFAAFHGAYNWDSLGTFDASIV